MMFKKMHKWIAIIVFLQLFVWLITGFLLGKLDHDLASGGNTFRKIKNIETPVLPRVSIISVLSSFPLATEVTLITVLDKPVYRITVSKDYHSYQLSNYILIDGLSGKQIQLDKSQVIKLAKASYQGQFNVTQTQLLMPPIEDLNQQQNPIWRVDTNDPHETSIFVSAHTGQVITHVNRETRWRNWLMMLHFMDYAQQGSFNNVFIKIFAFFTLLQAITGTWWLVKLIQTKQYKLTWFSTVSSINILDGEGQIMKSLSLKKNETILSGLNNNGVPIASICGGGGICGKCRFKSTNSITPGPSDLAHISQLDIIKGYRLACQHYVSEVSEITM